jgi:hypothetical protein
MAWEVSERTVQGLQQAVSERDERIKELEAEAETQKTRRPSEVASRHTEIQGALNALARLDDDGDQAAELRPNRLATIRGLLEHLLEDNKPEAPAEQPPITLGSRAKAAGKR